MTTVSQSGSRFEPRTVGFNFRFKVVAKEQLFGENNCHNVQQQCQQQLDYRTEGREAAPVRGQCSENQGTKLSKLNQTNTEDRAEVPLNGGDKVLLK